MTERFFNLVVPLAQEATAMRIADTDGSRRVRSGAVSPLIGASLRRGDVYLDVLDQFIKHVVGARYYVRYVDDFILLHESPQWLNAAHDAIEAFLPHRLGVRLNPAKTILQPVERGIDFVGHVIKPWHRSTRRRTVNEAVRRMDRIDADELLEVGNSYFGLLRQAQHSHHDRTRLANALRRRGHTIKGDLTKTYRRAA